MIDRTHIAALALQGIVGSTDEDGRPLAAPNFAAKQAVEYADALLALLAKIPPPAEQPEEKGDDNLPVTDRPAGGADYHESPASPGDLVAGEDQGAPSTAAAMPRSTGDGAKAARPARAREEDGRAGASGARSGSAVPGARATGAPAAANAVFECEVDRFNGDPPCPGQISYDAVSRGRFCVVHMVASPTVRVEWHCRNGDRNRAAKMARRIADAV